MSGTDAPVHQIVFRWDADLAVGGAGVGPVAWSGNRAGLEPIYRKVASLLSVPGDKARENLARVELRGEPGHESSVLLIRRIPDQDRGGRPSTTSHALLGSASVLTPARCLGLHAWRWDGSDINLREAEGRSLECVPAQVLRAATEPEAPALTERAGLFAGELTAVLTERLRAPRRRLSVLDHTDGDGPVHVLWALWNLAGRALPGWSFATHDTRDARPFRYVFVPEWPVSATRDQQLTRLDPARPGRGGDGRDGRVPDHGDQAGEAAARLAEHYLEIRHDPGALRGTRDALAERHVFEEERLDERVRLVHEALKWLSHAGSHRRTRTDRATEPREPRYDRSRTERYDTAYEGRAYEDRSYEDRADDGRTYESRAHDDRPYENQPHDDRSYENQPHGDRFYENQPHDTAVFDHMRQDQERSAVRAGTGLVREVTAGELRRALHHKDAGDYLDAGADRVLLEVLEGGLPAEQADRVAETLVLRAPHRSAADAQEVCERLLRAHLFLGPYGEDRDEDPVSGPDGRRRVAAAVHLYNELVRPYGERGGTPGLLRHVLPDLWHGHQGRGRAMLRQLIADGRSTGFGDQGWRALFEAATHPATTATAVREEPPPGRTTGRFRLTGRRFRDPRSRDRQSGDSRPPDDVYGRAEDAAGKLWVTALLALIAVAVILIAVILVAGS
ncbi:hypothetical protein [Streptomyces sp. NPDC052496]|uniref:hypothetical protein n=1 Tax=Streptomyces sp. NPDC052496 TaxID=3154951 RepID=UPI003444E8C7